MAWPLIAGMIAAGLLKSELVDKPNEEKDRKLQAETARLSPWTGLKPGAVKRADPFGTAMQFGATGASMGAGMDQAAMQKAMNEKLMEKMASGGNISTGEGLMAQGQSPWSRSYLGDYNFTSN